jgi:hypothetical protein
VPLRSRPCDLRPGPVDRVAKLGDLAAGLFEAFGKGGMVAPLLRR